MSMKYFLLPAVVLVLAASRGLAREARQIEITDLKVEYPDPHSFRVMVRAEGENVEVGSYGIALLRAEDVPPGFILESDGRTRAADRDIPAGALDGGRFDESGEEGVFAQTFSVKGWKDGFYTIRVTAHNRPAGGQYIRDHRTFSFHVTRDGEIVAFRPGDLENVQGVKVDIFKQEDVYAVFPRMVKLEEDTLLARFATKTVRDHITPGGGSKTMISKDGGLSWSDTDDLLVNPLLRNKKGELVRATAQGWLTAADEEEAERIRAAGRVTREDARGHVRYLSPHFERQVSTDGGRTWTSEVFETREDIIGLMTYHNDFSSYLVTSEGIRLQAVYGRRNDKNNLTEPFFLRSADDGETWRFISLLSASPEESGFELGFDETAIIETQEGHILALMRTNPGGYLYQSLSADEGLTWSRPEKTPMWGFPANLTAFPDGAILATYGYRRTPMGIRACVSRDGGKTWDIDNEYILRADGHEADLGYPISELLSDGSIFTIYYINNENRVRYIAGTRWEL